jgi:hypothetical protein
VPNAQAHVAGAFVAKQLKRADNRDRGLANEDLAEERARAMAVVQLAMGYTEVAREVRSPVSDPRFPSAVVFVAS